ncbi:MFS transporter [candidate division KSB1 bacterium]|nr:MFS transporter [candidate division KSB1 bacterium]
MNVFRFFATGTEKPQIQDKEKIDRMYRHNRLAIMLCISVGYGIAYTCRLGLSVVKKPLIDNNIFSAEQLGVIGSALLYGYAVGKLVNGFLADHANIRRFFSFGVLMSALINLSMGRTEHLWMWSLLWGLNGWFQGFGAPSGVVSLSHWFSNRERGRFYGLWSTGHSIGEGLTFVGSATLVSLFGWRYGFWGPGMVCIAVAVVVYFFMRDRPQTLGLPSVADWKNDHGIVVLDAKGKPVKTAQAQKMILKLPSIWVLALASAMMYMTRYAINGWGILYLQEARGFSLVKAGSMLGISTTAGIAGAVAYGFISDKLFRARRPPVNLICGILEISALVIIFFGPQGHTWLMSLAFAFYGFSLNGLVAALGGLFAVDIAPKKAAGAAMGFIGIFSYVAAAIQERISGGLIESGTTLVEGVRHYDFSVPILFWVGSSVVSIILATSLWWARVRD